MSNWFVLHVLSTHEAKIKRAIEDLQKNDEHGKCIEEVLLPMEKVAEIKKGQQSVSEKKIWPGYILVRMEMTDDGWHLIKNVNGVIEFLGGQHPTPLTENEVMELLEALEEKKDTVTQKQRFSISDSVKITEGVFINFVGTVVETNEERGRLSVMVSIFGRDTRVDDLEYWQVEEFEGEIEG